MICEWQEEAVVALAEAVMAAILLALIKPLFGYERCQLVQ